MLAMLQYVLILTTEPSYAAGQHYISFYSSAECSFSNTQVNESLLLTANDNATNFLWISPVTFHAGILEEAEGPCAMYTLCRTMESIDELYRRAVYSMHVVISRHYSQVWMPDAEFQHT